MLTIVKTDETKKELERTISLIDKAGALTILRNLAEYFHLQHAADKRTGLKWASEGWPTMATISNKFAELSLRRAQAVAWAIHEIESQPVPKFCECGNQLPPGALLDDLCDKCNAYFMHVENLIDEDRLKP